MKITIRHIIYTGLFVFLITQSCEKATIEGPSVDVPPFEDVQLIFDNYCIMCHPVSHSLDLTSGNSYDALIESKTISTDTSEAKNSVLYKKIDVGSHSDKINNAEDKAKLLKWLEAGAPND